LPDRDIATASGVASVLMVVTNEGGLLAVL